MVEVTAPNCVEQVFAKDCRWLGCFFMARSQPPFRQSPEVRPARQQINRPHMALLADRGCAINLHKITQDSDLPHTTGRQCKASFNRPEVWRGLVGPYPAGPQKMRGAVAMASVLAGVRVKRKTSRRSVVTLAQPAQGAAAVVVLAAVAGGLLSASVTLIALGSILWALLAYVVGGFGLAALVLLRLWLRARPVSPAYEPSKPVYQGRDCLVFGSRDTDLDDRVNVNRTPLGAASAGSFQVGTSPQQTQGPAKPPCPHCRSSAP